MPTPRPQTRSQARTIKNSPGAIHKKDKKALKRKAPLLFRAITSQAPPTLKAGLRSAKGKVAAAAALARSKKMASSPLHRDGFQIVKGAVDISPNLLKEIKSQSHRASPIFNQLEGDNDRKRRQCDLDKSSALVQGFYAQAQSVLAGHFKSPFLSAVDPVILHSKPGCQAQAAHCDYVPDANLQEATDVQMPLGVIIALMPGTKLRVWPGSARLATSSIDALHGHPSIGCVEAILEPGDMLFFRGDFVHAGSAYDKENFRVHFFADSALVPRVPNRTWLIDKDAPLDLQKIIRTNKEPTLVPVDMVSDGGGAAAPSKRKTRSGHSF